MDVRRARVQEGLVYRWECSSSSSSEAAKHTARAQMRYLYAFNAYGLPPMFPWQINRSA